MKTKPCFGWTTVVLWLVAGWVALAAPPARLPMFETGERFAGLDAELYPLGWAKDGERLAILTATPNEAADERTWKLQVMDLVTDERVLDQEILQAGEGGIDAFWAAHGAEVEEAVKPLGVTPASFSLHSFPALAGELRGETYEVSLEREYGKEPNFEYRGVRKLVVKISNGNGKTKTILEQSWEQWFPLAAGVVGYLPNPKGDRWAVLIAFAQRGYEGAPHIRTLTVVGARVGEKF